MDRRHFLFASAAASVSATIGAPTALADSYRSLSWPELLPPGEAENLAKQKALIFRRGAIHGSLGDTGPMNAIQPGTFKAVKALDGQKVKLSGYLVPLDFTSSKTSALLLVPYFGACIHAPPPPPNQTILVQARRPVQIPKLSSAVEAKGILGCSINTSEMGDSAYLLKLDSLREL